MSLLCYDFQKWTIMTTLTIFTVCLVGMISLVYGINDNGSLLNNGIIAPNDPEVSCNRLNSNCQFIFENQTMKLTEEELFKACTNWKGYAMGNYQVRLNNSSNCNPVFDYYIDHNWQASGEYNGEIIMLRIIARELG